MPTKKKYNSRFPPARIKKIMQTDEDIGKVAAPVPVILSKALEIFMQVLLEKACKNTQARHAKTMSTAHLKQCIISESQFDFLKELVEKIPDLPNKEEDVDDIDEPKAKRKKMAESSTMTCKDKATKKQKTKKEQKDINSMSDDFISDEEESSNSTESGSNSATGVHGTLNTSTKPTMNSTSTITKQMFNNHTSLPSNPLVPSTSTQGFLHFPNSSIPTPRIFTATQSEDDDYDS
ncbi:dr1-associated corepressor-like [Xenia sp. Carnegie-2017]|uniref:dr1-associated corepressor-like n=1 Tax=Xenia sp. Carnegie-2017 TaxID=2897299 RepID=UPI001F03B3A3|nr:dr1-associated corepressor-like [Xenia sp. Carnegie-2017]